MTKLENSISKEEFKLTKKGKESYEKTREKFRQKSKNQIKTISITRITDGKYTTIINNKTYWLEGLSLYDLMRLLFNE